MCVCVCVCVCLCVSVCLCVYCVCVLLCFSLLTHDDIISKLLYLYKVAWIFSHLNLSAFSSFSLQFP